MIGFIALVAGMLCLAIGAMRVSRRWSSGELLGIACSLGPVGVGWLVFVSSLVVSLTPATVLAGALAFLVSAVWMWRHLSPPWPRLMPRGRALAPALAVLVLSVTCSAVLRESWVEKPDGTITTGTANNLGDVVFHVGLAHSFVHGQNFPPDSIHFAGRRLAYSFIPDVTTAALIAGGWETGTALWVPASLALSGLLILVSSLTWRATNSGTAAALSPLLLLLAGGLRRIGDVPLWFGGEEVEWLSRPVAGAAWKNPFLSLLVTQRSTLMGLGVIAVIAVAAWLAFGTDERVEERERRRLLIGVGVLSGLLPLVFAHGFLALALILPALLLSCGQRDRLSWVLVGVPAALLAIPQVGWLLAEAGGGFIRWQPGWMSAGEEGLGVLRFARFWLVELGPFVPLALLGLAIPGAAKLRRAFWAPWWIAFCVASLFAVAPWIWDNTKLLVIWFTFAVVVVAAVLARTARHAWWGAVVATLAVGLLCLSGARDLGYVLLEERDLEEYAPHALIAARELRATTPPDAVFVEHPHWAQLAFLVGRRSFMGYPGHLWSHGIAYEERERDLQAFYRSVATGSEPERRSALRFLVDSGIDYVVVGSRERRAYGVLPQHFATWLETTYSAPGVSVFQAVPAGGSAAETQGDPG